MTVVHLIQKATQPIEIIIINERETFNKGIAFSPSSKKYLLNVVASKMSAFPSNEEHFLDWVTRKKEYLKKDRELLANSFLPRHLYGEYISDIWLHTSESLKDSKVKVNIIDGYVLDLELEAQKPSLSLNDGNKLNVDLCVIATGNQTPRNPKIINDSFWTSKNYFQNPWMADSITNPDNKYPILIIGNGLTMVDTVLGLLENKFTNHIYSISPNGFNILPHRHNGLKYPNLIEELPDKPSLHELVVLFNKHVKLVRGYGMSAEPVIDSIRPQTQKIWQHLSDNEKRTFMARLRHLWGMARHRIPTNVHDLLQQLRIEGRLKILSGRLINIEEQAGTIVVDFYDKRQNSNRQIQVSRVINCTGPDTDLMNMEQNFLQHCFQKGIVSQDKLKLGIRTDTETYQVVDAKGDKHTNIFTIGSNLRGELWESTAVNELRTQAELLANYLLKQIA